MKTNGVVAASAAILLQSQQVRASPVSNIVARAKINIADIAGIILPLLGINNIFGEDPEQAWYAI